MGDELQARADLEIHGLEIDILGFELVRLCGLHAVRSEVGDRRSCKGSMIPPCLVTKIN
jgi:hypothetical protein